MTWLKINGNTYSKRGRKGTETFKQFNSIRNSYNNFRILFIKQTLFVWWFHIFDVILLDINSMGVCCTQCTQCTYWHSNYVLNFDSITPSYISFVEMRHKLKLMISFVNVCVLYHHGWHNHQWKFQNAHIF